MTRRDNQPAALWAKVVAKAWSDAAYKQRLIGDPAAVLAAEGIAPPPGVQLKVVEDTGAVRHLVLPALPAEAAGLGDAVREERLAAVGCATNLGTSTAY